MLFARFDWFLNLGISSAIHLLAASGGKNGAQNPFLQKINNYLGIGIKFVLYVLKQLFASVSLGRSMFASGTRRQFPRVRTHKISSALGKYFGLAFKSAVSTKKPVGVGKDNTVACYARKVSNPSAFQTTFSRHIYVERV